MGMASKRELEYLISTTIPGKSELKEWELYAKDCIYLKIIYQENDIYNNSRIFQPIYTHQLFEKEKIIGYKSLKIELYFNASDLFTYFHVSYEARHESIYDDVQEKIASKLAPGWTKSLAVFIKNLKKNEFIPIGKELLNYNIYSELKDQNTNEDLSYALYQGTFDTPGLREFHERLQIFLLFYIESSNYIDSSDPIWQIILLFQKRTLKNKTTYCIVGYTTVYSFFSYPSFTKLRLSQILIIPPYQRRGHGKYLLTQVYENAKSNESIIEVNIEDPSPGFQRLRDSVDLQLCIENEYFQTSNKKKKPIESHLESWDPNSDYVKEIKQKLKITEKQILRCYDIFKLKNLDRDDEDEYKKYRLEIKSRLSIQHREELGVQTHDVNERKKKLHEFYEERENEYLHLIENLE